MLQPTLEEVQQQLQVAQDKIAYLETQLHSNQQTIDDLQTRIDLYQAIFQQAPFGISVTDYDGNFVDANPQFCDLVGYAIEKLMGKSFIDITHPDDIERDLTLSHYVITNKLAHGTIEKRYVRKDNLIIWAKVTAMTVNTNNNQQIFGVGIAEDISNQKKMEQTLELTEAQFQTIFETAPIGMAMADKNGNYLKTNFAFQQIFGYSELELLSMNSADLMKTSYVDKTTQITREKFRDSIILHMERRYQRKNKDLIWCDTTTFDIRNENNERHNVLYLVMDITERKLVEAQQIQAYQTLEQQIEERTHEIERRRRVSDSLRDILALLNSDKPLRVVLDEIVKQGAELLEVSGIAICSIHPETHITVRAHHEINLEQLEIINQQLIVSENYNKLLRNELVTIYDFPTFTDYIGKSPILLFIIPLQIESKVDGCVHLYYPDIAELTSEQKAIAITYTDQIALAIINATLREQIKQAVAIEERNRLARDLHDAVSQTLWSASLIAEILPQVWEQDIIKGREKLNQLKQLNSVALAEMRSLLMELRPQTLEDRPIDETLKSLITSINNRTNINIDYNIQCHHTIPTDVKVTFYRIAQEALNNIVKHANANHIDFKLVCKSTHVELIIQDNGIGFDPDLILDNHFGMTIMYERAKDIGANFEVKSQSGNGTTIYVTWIQNGAQSDD